MSRKRAATGDEAAADVDALYQLSLPEFTAARNALASRLKKSGRSEEAEAVKGLQKPPISAWTVNQLFWKHRSGVRQTAGRRTAVSHRAGGAIEWPVD